MSSYLTSKPNTSAVEAPSYPQSAAMIPLNFRPFIYSLMNLSRHFQRMCIFQGQPHLGTPQLQIPYEWVQESWGEAGGLWRDKA